MKSSLIVSPQDGESGGNDCQEPPPNIQDVRINIYNCLNQYTQFIDLAYVLLINTFREGFQQTKKYKKVNRRFTLQTPPPLEKVNRLYFFLSE